MRLDARDPARAVRSIPRLRVAALFALALLCFGLLVSYMTLAWLIGHFCCTLSAWHVIVCWFLSLIYRTSYDTQNVRRLGERLFQSACNFPDLAAS